MDDDDNVNTQATTNAAVPIQIQISLANDIIFGFHEFVCPIYVLVPNIMIITQGQISCYLAWQFGGAAVENKSHHNKSKLVLD